MSSTRHFRAHKSFGGDRALMTEIAHLHEQDEQLRRDMASGFMNINNRFDDLTREMKAAGKTNWSATAVMVSVISVLGALVWFPIDHRLSATEQRLTAHENIPGHTGVLIEHARHNERFTKHQRHLDGLDAANTQIADRFREQLIAMDNRLQLEMRLLQDSMDEKVASNRREIERVDRYGSSRWMGQVPE